MRISRAARGVSRRDVAKTERLRATWCECRFAVVRAVDSSAGRGHRYLLHQTLPHQQVSRRPRRSLGKAAVQFGRRARRLLSRSVGHWVSRLRGRRRRSLLALFLFMHGRF